MRGRAARVGVTVTLAVLAGLVALHSAGARRAAVADGSTGDPQPTAPVTWPFAFLRPDVEVDRGQRRQMDRRQVVTETPDAHDHVVSVFAASAIDVDADRLIVEVRDIEAFRTSEIVPIVRRFSSPPVPADLADLRLEAEDLDALARCKPRHCDLKLTPSEMQRIRAAIDSEPAPRAAVQAEFRRLVLDRVRTYLARGRGALAAYHDHDDPVEPAVVFADLLGGLGFLSARYPALARHVEAYPAAPMALVDSFLYWSIEDYAPKPIVTVWHDLVLRGSGGPGEPEVLIVSTQVMATHYMDGALAVTALVGDEADPARRYLVYVARVSVDVLGGFAGGIRRFFLERRLRRDARTIFGEQRTRIEDEETSGDVLDRGEVARRLDLGDVAGDLVR